jgi:hypothetical protein
MAYGTVTAVQSAVSGDGLGSVSWVVLIALMVPIPAVFAIAFRHRLASLGRQRAAVERVFRRAAARGWPEERVSAAAFLVPVDEVVCSALRHGYYRATPHAGDAARNRYLYFVRAVGDVRSGRCAAGRQASR